MDEVSQVCFNCFSFPYVCARLCISVCEGERERDQLSIMKDIEKNQITLYKLAFHALSFQLYP